MAAVGKVGALFPIWGHSFTWRDSVGEKLCEIKPGYSLPNTGMPAFENGTAQARRPESGGFWIEAGGWHDDGQRAFKLT